MKKKQVYKEILLGIGIIGISTTAFCQETPSSIVNEGILSVSTGDLVSFEGAFENTSQGEVINDGTTIYFHDFINHGYYGLTPGQKSAKAIFSTLLPNQIKHIHGDALSSFYDVEFTSDTKTVAFDLGHTLDVYGTVDFQNGIVKVDPTFNANTGVSKGMFSFQQGAKTMNVRDDSHIEGEVEKIGKEAFVFPIGDQGFYRPARISAPKDSKDTFTSQYVYNDQAFFERHATVESKEILGMDKREYWVITKGSDTTSDVLLTLSWDDVTSPVHAMPPGADLQIVRWDMAREMWVNEGGVMDMEAKEITTIVPVKGYGYFALAARMSMDPTSEEIIIYNLVTPNGDGKNDYFRIENIQLYPNNKVEIYNRWGTRVYERRNYDPNGDGSIQVFTGYSEGNTTLAKGSKLPSGTYYYVVTYERTDENGNRMIKKAANLHLETE